MNKNKKYEDLSFNLTNNMRNLIIEIIIINQMLKENNLNDEERGSLNRQRDNLLKLFKTEFQKHNIDEIKKYIEILDTK